MNLRELVARVLLSAFFAGFGVVVTFGEFGQTPKTGWTMFVSLIVVSIIWQYFALSLILGMTEKKWHSTALIIWIIISCMIGAYGLYLMASFDWIRHIDDLVVREFVWKMTIYVAGTSMVIAGICVRRPT